MQRASQRTVAWWQTMFTGTGRYVDTLAVRPLTPKGYTSYAQLDDLDHGATEDVGYRRKPESDASSY